VDLAVDLREAIANVISKEDDSVSESSSFSFQEMLQA
jgi:hypothetical protein